MYSPSGYILYLIYHVTSQEDIIEGSWKFGALCHFFDHSHCGSADIMFPICHLTSRNHMFKRCSYGWKSLRVSNNLAMFSGYCSRESRHIQYLICQVASQNYPTEWSSYFVSWRPSWHVTTLPTLVTIGTVVVEKWCF